VIRDVPENSHFNFEFLIPLHNLLQIESYKEPRACWDWVNFVTYVMIHPNASVEAMNSKTDALLTKYTGPNPPGTFIFTFQPLREVHSAEREDSPFNSISFYMLISLFILAIAWINYLNLSTARATERAKEVGVKKVMGVLPGQLINQFLVESLLFNFCSIALAFLFAITLLPMLGDLVDKNLWFDFSQPRLWIGLSGLFLIGSLISGIYPALILSSFKASDVIKGQVGKVNGALTFRKVLIVFQFVATLLLIAGTFTIYKQISFMQHHEKGMSVNQMLIVDGPRIIEEDESEERLISFKNELLNISFVQNVSSSESIPGAGYSLITGMIKLGLKENPNHRKTICIVRTDPDFINTYDIKLQSGSSWNPNVFSQHKSVIINEAALAAFELGDAEHALSEKLIIDGEDTVNIAGVFKNAHWNSLHSAHDPMLLWPGKISEKHFSIQLNGNIKESIAHVEQLYQKTFPENPFHYYFLGDSFNQQYKADQQFGKVFGMFSLLAIVVACLGLWGLASFTISKRMKEISIRKVLGASVHNITSLLSSQFLNLIVVAVLFAFPILWYGINSWLNGFAFRMDLTWDLFIIPMLILLVIMLVTVSFQTIKAALGDPVNGLLAE